MKLKSAIIALASLAAFTACQTGGSSKSENMTTDADSASYAIGVLIGQQNKQNLEASPGGDEFNKGLLVTAFEKTLNGEETKMTADEARTFIQGYFQKVAAKEGEDNKAAGEEFLAKNKEKEGVTVTESGLQYEVLTEGTGPKPTAEQTVKCTYHGTLLDGTVFDSSIERGDTATFAVNRVIPGWTEALQLMPVGSKWKLYIPGELAYGDRGAGQDIGPNETLIFEVELVGIVEE